MSKVRNPSERRVFYGLKMALHAILWLLTYIVVAVLVTFSTGEFMALLGVGGSVKILLSGIVGTFTGMYWAHRIACDFVSLGPDGIHE